MHRLGIAPVAGTGNSSMTYERRLGGRHHDPLDGALEGAEGLVRRPASPRKLAQKRLPSLLSPPQCDEEEESSFAATSPLCADSAAAVHDDDFDDDEPNDPNTSSTWPAAAFAALQHGIMDAVSLLEKSAAKQNPRIAEDSSITTEIKRRKTSSSSSSSTSSSFFSSNNNTNNTTRDTRELLEDKRRRCVNQTPTPSPSKEDDHFEAGNNNHLRLDEGGDGTSSSGATSDCSGGPVSPNVDAQVLGILLELTVLVDDVRRRVVSSLAAERGVIAMTERRLHSLQKSHDHVTQRLITSSSKIATLTTLLQQERITSKALLVHVARTGSAMSRAPPAPSADDPFDIPDDEPAAPAPRESQGTAPTTVLLAAPRAECACTILSTMRPHCMANDVLLSRRRLAQYIALIAQNPAALAAHHNMLAERTSAYLQCCSELVESYRTDKEQQLQRISTSM